MMYMVLGFDHRRHRRRPGRPLPAPTSSAGWSRSARTADQPRRSTGLTASRTLPHGPRTPDVPAARPGGHAHGRRSRSPSRWVAAASRGRPRDGSTAAAPPSRLDQGAACPSGENYHDLKRLLRGLTLNTVCEEAHCPNIGECWDQRTATIMILGDTCTRACGFCAVKTGRPTWFDEDEPRRVAEAIAGPGPRARRRDERRPRRPARRRRACLRRDDPRSSASRIPGMGVEVLIPDFNGEDAPLRTVMEAGPDILNHNVETVRAAPEAGPQARPLRTAPWASSSGRRCMPPSTATPVHTKIEPDGRPRRDARRADQTFATCARSTATSSRSASTCGPSLAAPAARSLLPPRRVRRDEGRGARARASSTSSRGRSSARSYHARDQVPDEARRRRSAAQAALAANGLA